MDTDHIEGGGRWRSWGRGRRGRNRHLDPVLATFSVGLWQVTSTVLAGATRKLLQNRPIEVSSQEKPGRSGSRLESNQLLNQLKSFL